MPTDATGITERLRRAQDELLALRPKPCRTCGSCPTCGKVAAPPRPWSYPYAFPQQSPVWR